MSDVAAKVNRAIALLQEGRLLQARAALEKVLARHPTNADANGLMALAIAQQGRPEQALFYARRAVKAQPGHAGWLYNLGKFAVDAGELDEAIDVLRRVLQVQPQNLDARASLLWALWQGRQDVDAASVAAEGLRIAPGDPRFTLSLAGALRNIARMDETVAPLRAAIAAHPGNLPLKSMLAFTLNYLPDATPEDIRSAHAEYAHAVHAAFGSAPPPARPRDPERKLRIGMISGDIALHPVASFLEPVLRGLDKERFDVALYYTGANEDDTTRRLASYAAVFRNIPGTDLHELDRTIRGNEVDILLDLSGHTAYHRLPVFALRPAPVQGTYLGYPNTTGLEEVDFRIVDSHTDPPGAEAMAVERLVRIDPCFLCYVPPDDLPEARAARGGDGGGGVRFVSFNALPKLNERVFALWSRILKTVEGSTLLIKEGALRQESSRRALVARFERFGVDPARITAIARTPSHREHMELYNSADIALDSFPYNGTTTTCEALLMGVPVVGLAGRMHAGRVGLSLLTNAGAPELVAKDEEDYARIAIELARDGARRRTYHGTLRARLLESPVCDEAGFAQRFGGALREAWRRWCAAPGASA